MVKWSPPPVGVVKANWDVAVDMKNGKLGYGCVIRDISNIIYIPVVIYKLHLVMWNF
jgi:hypothetical protein